MKYPHIETGPHREAKGDPRFRINTAPGIKKGVNEAHSSYLQRPQAIELREELTAWINANPTDEEIVQQQLADAWDEGAEALEHHQMHVSGGWPANPYREQEEA